LRVFERFDGKAYDETASCSRIARGIDWFVRDAGARSTDELGGSSAPIRERGEETAKIDEEKRQAAAESPETSGQGSTKVAEGGTKGRREGQPALCQ
jgi:hypothetical protein